MSLSPGSSLGPYEITEAIGAGGMGEVYRARDTRLDRSVAIKVLPAHLSTHPELKQRLEREAKTISSLNHPHICALFDVGHEGDVDFLVMELIEGETLADRLEKGPLPVEQVVRFGQQIAAALDAAHKSGVVHRDLKPGNIMVTRSGVKLLDFGLAKIVEGGMDPTSGITQMATQATPSQPITQQGTILGTFQYMAPEQLEGRDADARSDIFALGAILYEMVAGKKAFEGASQASLIAAIIERTPAPVSSIQPLSPASLERLIGACISKDPDDRVQTAHDVLLQLRWIEEGGSDAGMAAPVSLPKRRDARLPWVLAIVFGIAAAALAFMTLRDTTPEPTRVVTHLRAPEGASFLSYWGGHLALSPDGNTLAFVAFGEGGEPALWVRSLDNPQPRMLGGTENGFFPFWSPDSKHIGFFSSGRMRRVSADGGPAMTICAAGTGRGGSWNADGVIVFAASTDDPISRVNAGGGDPVAITEIDTTRHDLTHRWPMFLPDGNHYLFTIDTDQADDAAIYIGSLDGTAPRRLLAGASNLGYSQGHLLYVRDNTLVGHPFDADALELTGDPFTIAEPIDQHRISHADFSASSNGTLVYSKGGEAIGSALGRYDREGILLGMIEIPFHSDDFALSPDGRTLLYMRVNNVDSEVDIWRHELERGLASRLTFAGNADDPIWSPDGTQMMYAAGGQLYRKSASGAGTATLVYETQQDKVTHDWSRDGRHVVFSVVSAATREDLWVLDPDEPGSARALIATPFREFHGQFSPDGNWIAYTSDESGRPEVYVQSYPSMTGKWQISRDGGSMPRWRGDGKELFFVDIERGMHVAAVVATGDVFAVAEVHKLFDTRMYSRAGIRTHQYVVSSDGQELIIADRPAAADRVGAWAILVQNWLSGR